MKLSILTGIIQVSRDFDGLRDLREVLQVLHDVGYDTVDVGFVEPDHPDFIFRGDDWEKKIEALGNTAAKLGMTIAQSHLPTPKGACFELDPNWKKSGYPAYFDQCMERAYLASGMLGVPYGTVHPLTYLDTMTEPWETMERNHRYYDRFVELGIRCHVGTAIENMRPDSPKWPFPARYCQNYRELIELVDSFHDPMVGICWDTGHANHSQCNQVEALRAIGGRLKNLHINDNHYGMRDEHLLPFMGTVDWDHVIPVLAEIGYQGVLNYEVGKVARSAPRELQVEILKTVYANGNQLLRIYQQAKERQDAGAAVVERGD